MEACDFVDCAGVSLLVRRVGTGRAIVFVPGLGSGHGMFAPQVDAFGSTHHLILPDLRGNGGSARLTGPVSTILDRQADDLAALLDRLAIDRAVIVGVSYGGVVAIHFALRHTDRAAGLVVVDSFGSIDKRRPIELLFWVGSYLGLPICYLPKPWMRTLLGIFYRRWPVARGAITGLVAEFRSTEAVLQSLAMNAVDYRARLGSIACPALGVVGDYARTGVELMRRVVEPIAGARLEVIADSFDPSNLCRPDEFNRVLAAFLAEIGW
ncbi:MAG: alpha/beta hydrolase [Isosphaeraceae bacterium]|nr:alpha/beta hydrolase [Isosphaeraceae bacterium]